MTQKAASEAANLVEILANALALFAETQVGIPGLRFDGDWKTIVVVAFIFALIVVKTFIAFISRFGLVPFAWYRIVGGIVVLAALAFGV